MTIFQKILNGEIPSVKIYENELIYSFMDAFPQSTGHALIIPKQPAPDLFTVAPEALSAIILFSQKLALAQKEALHPDGIKVMQFNGASAGQTVFHYHMHLIPVWDGQDLAGHRQGQASPEALLETAQKIMGALKV